jgi:hypothetical protein
MCIILTKPKGIKSPSWNSIVTSCERNPDGFAVAWHKAGMERPEVKRTLDKKEFLEYMKPITEDDNTSWVLHARIKSVGPINIENCHCWRDERTDLIFCHNGTLSIKAHGGMTDSETFFRNLYIPAVNGGGDGAHVVEAIIGSSKFAFMKKDGSIVTYGTYVTDKDYPGVQFSNGSYKEYKAPATTISKKYSYGGYGNSYKAYYDYDYDYGYDEDEYDWRAYGYAQTEPEPAKTTTSTSGSKLLLAHHGWHFFRSSNNAKASDAKKK